MTDVPWATAWYGDRSSVWLTLKHREEPGGRPNDFYGVHQLRPLSGLYLAGTGLGSINTAEVAQWRQDSAGREGDDWTEFLRLASGLVKSLETPERAEEAGALRRLLQLSDQHWPYGQDRDWPDFLLGIFVNGEVPTGFPLRRAPFGLWPEVFLTQTERNPAN